MAQLLTAKGVAERSLRMIQAFSINDTSADPEELRETLYWMEMLLDHKAATNKLYFLIPADVLVPLPAAQSFPLVTQAAGAWPTNGVLMFHYAKLIDGSNNETELRILRRDEYEAIDNKTQSGRPQAIYIDRLDPNYTASLWPVPSDTSYSAKLVLQTYNLTVALDNKSLPQTNNQHGLQAGWQLWLVTAVAAAIGRGAVRTLPPAEIKDLQASADGLFSELYINSNNERPSGARVTRSSDSRFDCGNSRGAYWRMFSRR